MKKPLTTASSALLLVFLIVVTFLASGSQGKPLHNKRWYGTKIVGNGCPKCLCLTPEEVKCVYNRMFNKGKKEKCNISKMKKLCIEV